MSYNPTKTINCRNCQKSVTVAANWGNPRWCPKCYAGAMAFAIMEVNQKRICAAQLSKTVSMDNTIINIRFGCYHLKLERGKLIPRMVRNPYHVGNPDKRRFKIYRFFSYTAK